MASKALLVLGFLLAALVLISSEVAARELGENAEEVQTADPVNDAKQYYGGYPGRGYPGGGYPGRGYPGGGYPGRGYPGGGYPGRGYPGGGYPGGGRCRYGCCGRGYYGCRCCTYAGEVPDFEAEVEPHN